MRNTVISNLSKGIFIQLIKKKKASYDKQYIEELYLKYMEEGEVQEKYRDKIKTDVILCQILDDFENLI